MPINSKTAMRCSWAGLDAKEKTNELTVSCFMESRECRGKEVGESDSWLQVACVLPYSTLGLDACLLGSLHLLGGGRNLGRLLQRAPQRRQQGAGLLRVGGGQEEAGVVHRG